MTPEEFARRAHDAAEELRTDRQLIQRVVLTVEARAKPRTPVKTATLKRSITSVVETATRGRVGTNVSYAAYVHEGTRHMPARPFLREGVDDAQHDIDRLLAQAGERVLGRMAD